MQKDLATRKQSIIRLLDPKYRKRRRIYHFDIPEELQDDWDIINAERKCGIRVIDKIGFDIINQCFFVEELVYCYGKDHSRTFKKTFLDFESYYNYLDGRIYDNACYYGLNLDKITKKVDTKKLFKRKSFIDNSINDFGLFTKNKNNEGITLYKKKISKKLEYNYVIHKEYYNNTFVVTQEWIDAENDLAKRYRHRFNYFFDFVSFLNGDLSNADLLLCDGLRYLKNLDGINLTNAAITSSVLDEIGIKYEKYEVPTQTLESFVISKKNEEKTSVALRKSGNLVSQNEMEFAAIKNRHLYSKELSICYVSDLHLLHRIKNAKPKNYSDVLYTINRVAARIANETGEILLIDGDVSSCYSYFETFVSQLKIELKRHHKYLTRVISTLGNHELWDFPNHSLDEIVDKYRKCLAKYGMLLLQNNIIYSEVFGWNIISTKEITEMSTHKIGQRLKKASIILFGGIGFSGCNEEFNANNLIYRQTINRDQEIKESAAFEKLYEKIKSAIPDRNVIILTHMPLPCWRKEVEYQKGYIYVSGHTHENYFHDDGEERIYADNQIGYKGTEAHLKYFQIDLDYDFFSDYKDGIYTITREEYKDFHRGKNIMLTFNRKYDKLYMLKKSGYYLFLLEQNKSLYILNGGQIKKVDYDDINYYYDNMEAQIARIKGPLDEYTEYQKKIAAEIRKIGGTGKIHGCIIDINFYNHVYVHPTTGSIVGYFAFDIIDKFVYPSVEALLEDQTPWLYGNYKKLLEEQKSNLPILSRNNTATVAPREYLETDIYRVSREIKKMQRLESNILAAWYEERESKREIDSRHYLPDNTTKSRNHVIKKGLQNE